MILFTQTTAVLHKYLNDELKVLSLLQFFHQVAQNSENSLNFPRSQKSEYSRFSRFVATLNKDIKTWTTMEDREYVNRGPKKYDTV